MGSFNNGIVAKLAELISDIESDEVQNYLQDLDNVITEHLERIDELSDALQRIRELTSVI